MSTIQKTARYAFIAAILVAGAAFFYATGLGTGLYIAQRPHVAAVPASPTATLARPALSATPVPASPSPTARPLPTSGLTPTASPTQTTGQEDTFGIFWEAWDTLQSQFYGQLPTESELPYAAIQGVIAATGDQYTAFLDPVRAEILRADLSGSFEGIGATVRIRSDGKLEIVQPLPNHPALEAGLRAKDVILKVDDIQLEGMNIYEAVALIRGPAGTIVRLLVEREGLDEPIEVQVRRAHIEMPTVESEMLEDGIAYLRLNEFGQTATSEVKEALRSLSSEDPRGLILDLRGNPGGYLSTAVEVTSQFVGQGPILIEEQRDGTKNPYPAIGGGLALDIPLVVLIDGGSASASEIAAGAIQDTERGVLVGTQTLGKGSVQLVNTLTDGSQLRVTTAVWFTPNGRAIHGTGLKPDIEVEIAEEDLEAGRDPQLDRAIQYLLEGR